MRNIDYTRQFLKEWAKAQRSDLSDAIKNLVTLVKIDPFQTPPPYEKLRGCDSTYSRRINRQHRLVYKVYPDGIEFLRCWGHYK